MGDDEHGDVLRARQLQQETEDLAPDRRVEAGHRLIGHEQLGRHHHGAGDDDPLPLAAGELVGIAQQEPLGRAQPTAGERLGHQQLLVGQPVDAGPFGHDLVDRLAGVERARRILEDQLRLTPQLPAGRRASVDRPCLRSGSRPRSPAGGRARRAPASSCRSPTRRPRPAPRPAAPAGRPRPPPWQPIRPAGGAGSAPLPRPGRGAGRHRSRDGPGDRGDQQACGATVAVPDGAQLDVR